jgi:hypothetical protein
MSSQMNHVSVGGALPEPRFCRFDSSRGTHPYKAAIWFASSSAYGSGAGMSPSRDSASSPRRYVHGRWLELLLDGERPFVVLTRGPDRRRRRPAARWRSRHRRARARGGAAPPFDAAMP